MQKNRHLRTIAQLFRAISSQLKHINRQSEKNLLNSNIFSTRLHNMVTFGLLVAEIRWRVWATPANFNGFRVLASLLQRRRSTEANQTLHGVWTSPGCYTTYTFSGLLPRNGILHVLVSSPTTRVPCSNAANIGERKTCALLYWQRYCTAIE